MLSFIKNSLFAVLAIGFISACNNETKPVVVETAIKKDTAAVIEAPTTFTILQYGELQPPLYTNALDIIAKRYGIVFKDAAGCVVNDKLVDSISNFNQKTYSFMDKVFEREMEKEIDKAIISESSFLNKLDVEVRKNAEIRSNKFEKELIYYNKKGNNYFANVILAVPDKKVLIFKLKLVAAVDSATGKLSNVVAKDSVVKQFNDLQL